MAGCRLKILCTEIFKTLHNLNPPYMKNIFEKSVHRTSIRFNQNISSQKQFQHNFGTRSIRVLGPKIWNNLPNHVKSVETLSQFKLFMKTWDGVKCNCSSFLYLRRFLVINYV